jgi:hypothetical protein
METVFQKMVGNGDNVPIVVKRLNMKELEIVI